MAVSALPALPACATVLLVAPTDELLQHLREALAGDAYRILPPPSDEDAAWWIEQDKVDVVVSDLPASGPDALDLVVEARRKQPQGVRIVLTGVPCVGSAM